jgi:hypothetical protein
MVKEPIEGEVIQQPEGFKYKEQYKEYSQKTKGVSTFAWSVSFLSLLFSLVPIIGFVFALFALVVAGITKTPKVIPLVALFISSVITMIVLFISWIISLIF